MPADFERCVAARGSIVRTKTLSKRRYIRLCKTRAGKWYAGEVQAKKSPRKSPRRSPKRK